jgi:glycosyltransferase involved in cell wall biosynthesis
MKGLNEEKQVERVMKNVHDEPYFERIIVIDGGSTDFTVQALREWEKPEVFVHKWENWFHDMETTQSNIALCYVPHGQMLFILDFDERLTDGLKEELQQVQDMYESRSFHYHVGHVPRRTYEPMRFPESHFAILSSVDGWPMISHQIGQYPDYQCRLIVREVGMHWVNSPHHVLWPFNAVAYKFEHDLEHFEKDDFRDRTRIEKLWLRAQARRQELGLSADVFECDPKKEIVGYVNPDKWKDHDETT